jgi:hypothetical protein
MFSAGHIGEALWEMAEEIRRLQASIEQVRLEAAWDESMIWHKLLGSVDPCLGAVDVVAEARTEQAEQIRLLKEKMNDLGDLAENRLHRLRVGTDKQRAMREQIRLLREVRDWMDRGHGDCADWCEPNQPCVNCTLKLKLDAILAAGALEGGDGRPSEAGEVITILPEGFVYGGAPAEPMTRREMMELPVAERREILSKQADQLLIADQAEQIQNLYKVAEEARGFCRMLEVSEAEVTLSPAYDAMLSTLEAGGFDVHSDLSGTLEGGE